MMKLLFVNLKHSIPDITGSAVVASSSRLAPLVSKEIRI